MAGYISFAVLVGMPRDAAPESYRDFRAYFDGFLASGNAWLTDEARYTGHAIAFEIPMAAHMQPFKRLHDLVMLGSLLRAYAGCTDCAGHPRMRSPSPLPSTLCVVLDWRPPSRWRTDATRGSSTASPNSRPGA